MTPIVGYVGSYSSNIFRTTEDEQWEYINRPLLGMDIDHRGRSFNAYGHAVAEYFDYTQDLGENETYFDINAIARWNIIGDRFTWDLEDYASVTPIVISDPVTPINVEQRNIFVTGPTFSTRLGSRNLFDWSLRYGNFYYSLSDIGNQRYYSDVGITRRINPNSGLRLGYQITRTIFSEEVYQDYFRQDLGLTFDHLTAGGNFSLSGGLTYISEEETNESVDGWFLRFVGSKRVGHRTLLNMIASSGLSDTGLANLSSGVSEVIPDVEVEPNQAFGNSSQAPSTDIFRNSILSFNMVNTRPVLVTTAGLGYVQADYVTDITQDNQRLALDLNFEYDIRSDALLGVFLRAGRTEYPNLEVETVVDNDTIVGANLTKQIFRRVNLGFDISRLVRNSNRPDRGYTDTVAEIRLIYRPSGRRTATRSTRGR